MNTEISLDIIRKVIEPKVRKSLKVDVTQKIYDSLVILANKEYEKTQVQNK